MNILLIEDEPLIQKSLKKLLERQGAVVEVESSGKAALNLILEKSYERIVCDLMLQDITGFDIIEGSKKRYTRDEIMDRFLIITAYSSEQVLQRAAQYGCPILLKPFENIQQAIQIMIKGHNEK